MRVKKKRGKEMFCNKCGAEIESGMTFCTNCGNRIMQNSGTQRNSGMQQNSETYQNNSMTGNFVRSGNVIRNGKEKNGSSDLQKIARVVSAIAWAVLVIAFIKTMVSYYDSNMKVFDWMNDENKLMGIFMYWLVPVCVIIDGIIFVLQYAGGMMKGKALMMNGISVFVFGLVLKVGRAFFDDWSSSSDMSVILYRVFGTYSVMIKMTFSVAVLIFIMGILSREKREE